MESIFSVIVVLYLVASVISAVVQSMKNPKRTASPRIPRVEPVAKEERPQPKADPAAAQPVLQTQPKPQSVTQSMPDDDGWDDVDDGFDSDWVDDDFEGEFDLIDGPEGISRTKPAAAVVSKQPEVGFDQRIPAQRMREAVILSEILREPRALRPWPLR